MAFHAGLPPLLAPRPPSPLPGQAEAKAMEAVGSRLGIASIAFHISKSVEDICLRFGRMGLARKRGRLIFHPRASLLGFAALSNFRLPPLALSSKCPRRRLLIVSRGNPSSPSVPGQTSSIEAGFVPSGKGGSWD